MQLLKGYEEEYQKRHDAVWPELSRLLKESGISEYSIFLDDTTSSLFAVLTAKDARALNNLPQHPVMQRWWHFMADIMETKNDHSPITVPLKEVFYLP